MWNVLRKAAGAAGNFLGFTGQVVGGTLTTLAMRGGWSIFQSATSAFRESSQEAVAESKELNPGETRYEKFAQAMNATARIALNVSLGVVAVSAATSVGGLGGGFVASLLVDHFIGTPGPTDMSNWNPYNTLKAMSKVLAGTTLKALGVAFGSLFGVRAGIFVFSNSANKVRNKIFNWAENARKYLKKQLLGQEEVSKEQPDPDELEADAEESEVDAEESKVDAEKSEADKTRDELREAAELREERKREREDAVLAARDFPILRHGRRLHTFADIGKEKPEEAGREMVLIPRVEEERKKIRRGRPR